MNSKGLNEEQDIQESKSRKRKRDSDNWQKNIRKKKLFLESAIYPIQGNMFLLKKWALHVWFAE